MTEYADLAEWALFTLRADSRVTALVMDGASGVVESGELEPDDLGTRQQRRLRDPDTYGAQALAVLVMDTGEQGGDTPRSTCTVFVYDRAGYARIRNAREAVIESLAGQSVALKRGMTVVKLRFQRRTGHELMREFELDYERVDFEAPLVGETDLY